ncbi:MAG TPA: fused MFS/spermidine synthase, partial [Dehalococcoidia bacterium]|nr:fused MFS/spermidine synthase [Dehalococcoidia bacterium]
LVAGRILAPYVGVSIYTWTSVIGVVLAGISLGNYLGGKVADRWASPRLLGLLFVLGGLSTLAIIPAILVWGGASLGFQAHIMIKIVLITTIIFFLPACILGMISPVVIKLALEDLKTSGNVVGKIYAFSTLGAIAGTFATGFFLISMFGTRLIIAVVALVLVLMGIIFGELWRPKGRVILPLVALFLGAYAVFATQQAFASPFYKETNYYTIRVQDDDSKKAPGRPLKVLILDRLIHSYNHPNDPLHLEYDYEYVYVDFMEYIAAGRPDFKALFLGGGGYTHPRYTAARWPQSTVDVVEIDPEVTETAHEMLGLERDTPIRTFNQDARLFFLEKNGSPPYDLIFGDAFNDISVPYHLTTKEFAEMLKANLKPDGYYVANVIDNIKEYNFLRSYAYTLSRVFKHVYLLSDGEDWKFGFQNTFVVVAGDTPIGDEYLRKTAPGSGDSGGPKMMPLDEWTAYLNGGQAVLLTDDHVPVDDLTAPLHAARGF